MDTLARLRSGHLHGATRLNLACGLTEFPREIFDLADSLEILDLSHNALCALPDDLARLHKLRIVFCSNNQFTELPRVLGQCPQLSMVGFKSNQIHTVPAASLPRHLRWLILTDNQIQTLPTEIGQCTQLQKLMLAGNQLQALPAEIAQCTRLELLRIAANHLTTFPAQLLTLPRLAWLAYAGNPFCAALEQQALEQAPMASIHWSRLQLGPTLGEGASGVIYQATLQDAEENAAELRPVAVKLFKGAVTSDGLPHCEMLASLRAGQHPNLIPVLGQVVGHPAQAEGLVMSLIDPAFVTLAGPPSLESCTRDIYAPDLALPAQTAHDIVQAISAAAHHLHAQGILHGDLYAHNILYRTDAAAAAGTALLGDFGAASLFDPADTVLAQGLQRMEMRALSCLQEELRATTTGL